jgi:hypothetical protein
MGENLISLIQEFTRVLHAQRESPVDTTKDVTSVYFDVAGKYMVSILHPIADFTHATFVRPPQGKHCSPGICLRHLLFLSALCNSVLWEWSVSRQLLQVARSTDSKCHILDCWPHAQLMSRLGRDCCSQCAAFQGSFEVLHELLFQYILWLKESCHDSGPVCTSSILCLCIRSSA